MGRGRSRSAGAVSGLASLLLLPCGCAGAPGPPPAPVEQEATTTSSPDASQAPSASRTPRAEPASEGRGPTPSDGRPGPALLSIPSLDLHGLRVVPYRGWTDDAPGTRIQNAGDAASPYGPRGGVGPGGIGNYQVTGHRLSSTMPFRYLPQLGHHDRVLVEARGRTYVYRVMATRRTSFQSPRSLRQQRAAVPGRPSAEPTQAMITLSTCATIEDHAAGNYWSDRFDNPEHRIDKIGVLVAVRR